MADLYDYPDIYDERFTDGANKGCLTSCLAELGYHVSGMGSKNRMVLLDGTEAAEHRRLLKNKEKIWKR